MRYCHVQVLFTPVLPGKTRQQQQQQQLTPRLIQQQLAGCAGRHSDKRTICQQDQRKGLVARRAGESDGVVTGLYIDQSQGKFSQIDSQSDDEDDEDDEEDGDDDDDDEEPEEEEEEEEEKEEEEEEGLYGLYGQCQCRTE